MTNNPEKTENTAKANSFSRWLKQLVMCSKKNEISTKLARELLERCYKIEAFADKKAKEGHPSKWDVDSDWMTIGCWISEMKQHILWHTR